MRHFLLVTLKQDMRNGMVNKMKMNDVIQKVLRDVGYLDGVVPIPSDENDEYEIGIRGKYNDWYLFVETLAMRMKAGDIILNIEEVGDSIKKKDYFYKLLKEIEGYLENGTN